MQRIARRLGVIWSPRHGQIKVSDGLADALVVMNYATIKSAAQKRSNKCGVHYRLYMDSMGWTVRAIPRESLRGAVEPGEIISPILRGWDLVRA